MQNFGPMPAPAPERHSPRFRRLALLCASLLSCTTIRTPVSTIAPEVAVNDGRAEPQLELWVESNRPLTPEEAERFRREARSALEKALEGRSEPDGDSLVVIRAQGITRTPGHRHDQVAATAGMVVGAVVIVAAVVVAIVAGSKSGGGSSGPKGLPSASAPRAAPGFSAGRGSPALARGVGRSPGSLVRVPPRFPTVPAPRVPTAPAPRHLPVSPAWAAPHGYVGPGIDVEVGLWWVIPVWPEPPPVYVYEPLPPPAVTPPASPLPEDAAPALPDEPPARPDQLAMEPPELLPVEDRGFFAGDRLVLEAVVLDRATGEALWVKRLERKIDPRNAPAVKGAVDALLSEGGWQPPPGA